MVAARRVNWPPAARTSTKSPSSMAISQHFAVAAAFRSRSAGGTATRRRRPGTETDGPVSTASPPAAGAGRAGLSAPGPRSAAVAWVVQARPAPSAALLQPPGSAGAGDLVEAPDDRRARRRRPGAGSGLPLPGASLMPSPSTLTTSGRSPPHPASARRRRSARSAVRPEPARRTGRRSRPAPDSRAGTSRLRPLPMPITVG